MDWPIWEHILDSNFIDSARYGVLEAFPFLDKRIMQLSLDIHPKNKIANGYTREVLRQASFSILPKKITRRKNKSNLSPAINNFFRKLKSKKDYLNLLVAKESPLKGLINEKKIKQIYLRNRDSDNVDLYKIISLARWMKKNNFRWGDE